MKYLSLIAIAVLLQVSWWVTQQNRDLTMGQQNLLLKTIKEYMTQVVKNKDPQANEIKFSNLHTETVDPGRTLRAHFKFSYLLPSTTGEAQRIFRKGHFLVTSSDGKQWVAQIDEIRDAQVEFLDPQAIIGSASGDDKI